MTATRETVIVRDGPVNSVAVISTRAARQVIEKYHYSKVMPRLTRLCIGGFCGDELVAVCTLGYGVRPLHTLKLAFPTCEVADYLEIGKLCVSDAMPRNTESAFIADVAKMVRRFMPQVKLLYSWADGIIGKPGYVYQASNFFYGGFIWTEMYLSPDGVRVHPRTMQGLSDGERADGARFRTRDFATTRRLGFKKYFGLQFRYVYPLCHKQEWKAIQAASPFTWTRGNYPKDSDLQWQAQVSLGERVACERPPFTRTNYIREDGPLLALMSA